MNSPLEIFIMLKMTSVSVLIFAGLAFYRTGKRRKGRKYRIPIKNPWCQKYFPRIGFAMFVSGLILFIVGIILSRKINIFIHLVDLGLAVFVLGITLIGLVAKKSEDGFTGSSGGGDGAL